MVRKYALIALIIVSILLPVSAQDTGGAFSKQVGQIDSDKLTCFFIDLDVDKGSEHKSGDCALIITPDGKSLLIDCGHPDTYADLEKVLDALEIDTIDCVLISHPHIDHLGAFPLLAANHDIGMVYRTKLEYPTFYARAAEAAVKKFRIPGGYLAEGDSFRLGDYVQVNVLWPEAGEIEYPPGYPDNSTQFVNDFSIVMQVVYGESVALFAGDLYRSGERKVIKKYGSELKCDLAKMNHHGNSTSSSLSWVKRSCPQVAVAMHDMMGSMNVLNSYKKRGTVCYHTHYNGLVKVELDDSHHVEVTPQYESWVEQ